MTQVKLKSVQIIWTDVPDDFGDAPLGTVSFHYRALSRNERSGLIEYRDQIYAPGTHFDRAWGSDLVAYSLCNADGSLLAADWPARVEAGRREADLKHVNPKHSIGISKVPLHLVSGVVKAYQAVAHFLGNVKYGAWNYIGSQVTASVYVSALYRHMDKWVSGEKYDKADGTPHLANALACINILIDAEHHGTLIDDRPPSIDLDPIYQELEKIMANIREKYKDLPTPYHYSIKDTKQ